MLLILPRKFQQRISTARLLPLTISKKRTLRDTVIIIVSSFLFGHFLFWLLPGLLGTWNAKSTDQLFELRYEYFPALIPYDSTVRVVNETDSTLRALTDSYLSRRHYGQVVRNLGDLGVAVQIYDYIFNAPQDTADDAFLMACNRHAGNAYFGMGFALKDEQSAYRPPRPASTWEYLSRTKWHVQVEGDVSTMYVGVNPRITFPKLALSARGLGSIALQFDQDGVFRRAPLLVRYEDGFYPSFAFRAICDYLRVPPENILVHPGKSVTLKDAHRPGVSPHDIVIPVDERCNIIVNFVGPWHRIINYDFALIYHASDDCDNMEYSMKPEFEGKLIVVADASTGATDIAPVPTDNNYPLSGLHANVMHTILTENFLRELVPWELILIELVLLGFVAFFALNLSSRGLWVGALLLLVGYLLLVVTAFLFGNLIFNIVRPVIITLVAVFGVLVYRFINEEREKEATQRSFEAYLPPSVVKRQLAHPESIFEVQKKELTIMFTDIKSFTTYSSTMTPDQIQNFLAEYFDAMVQIVFKYEGTVDKYIGDGLMVFFGAPEPQADHAVRCVKAAIEMQKKCRELKEKWVREGLFPLKIRVGINTGEVVVGNMGTRKKLAYTVLGSDVNLANRLESNAPVEGIMISRRTYDLIKDEIPTLPHEPVLVKGLDIPIEVYTVPVDETSIS
jgi:adenylate cyclase